MNVSLRRGISLYGAIPPSKNLMTSMKSQRLVFETHGKPADVLRWYYGDNQRMAEVEAIVIENNVTEFVLGKALITEKSVSFDELMAQN
jgi:FKBP-type peptidyl-prolyl cis-trans isomerase (trigger factor)